MVKEIERDEQLQIVYPNYGSHWSEAQDLRDYPDVEMKRSYKRGKTMITENNVVPIVSISSQITRLMMRVLTL